MGNTPKVENSELKPEIDELLLQGNSYKYIAKWCVDRGLRVSHASIQRYVERNLPELRNNVEMKPNPDSETIQDMTPNPFVINTPKVKNSREFYNLMNEKLRSLTAVAACILETKMREHALGKTKYPRDEIAGLEKIISIYNIITSKKSNDRAGNSNILTLKKL